MKKRGFTLIELLAVITILGILTVMIVPKVTEILEQSEEDAYQRQINSIISIAKKWGASNNDELPDELEVLCTAKKEVTNGNKAEGNYNYGDEYSCNVGDGEAKTFYVLDTSGDNVSLIMNANIDSNGKGTTSGNTVAWCTYDDHIASGRTDEDWMNYDGTTVSPVTALKYLKSSTRSWVNLEESQIGLPSIYQLVDASDTTDGYSPSLDLVSSPYFSWANWIYENLNSNTAPYGYWVSDSLANLAPSVSCYNYNKSWYPYCEMTKTDEMGVRPVITISKNQIDNQTQDVNALYLSLDTLVDEGYIKEKKIMNPKTDEKLEGCIKISYDSEYSQYVYEYVEDANVCK